MLEYIDEDNLLDFLGGKSSWYNEEGNIIEVGPWLENGVWDPSKNKNIKIGAIDIKLLNDDEN